MALPRVCSLVRVFASRGSSTRIVRSKFPSTCTSIQSRSFVSTSKFFEDLSQENATKSSDAVIPIALISKEQQAKNSRSVKLFKLPRRVTRSAVEAMFSNAGFHVVDVHMYLDRFRWEGDTYASVELADEQQAQEAIEALNGNDSLGNKVYLRALKPEFTWDEHLTSTDYSRLVLYTEDGIKKAVQPYIDGRRVRISVKSPAWGDQGDTPTQRRVKDLRVLERTFDQFGIESISRVVPQYGHSTYNPKYFCHIDFSTKHGAEEAIRAIHNTKVQGVLVWAKLGEVDPAKAYQIGRVNKALLAKLQEKGLAPSDSEIHEDWVSQKTKKDPMAFDRKRNWTGPGAPGTRAYRPNATPKST